MEVERSWRRPRRARGERGTRATWQMMTRGRCNTIYDRYTERPMLPCMLRCYHATTMLLGGEGVQRCRRLRGRKLVEGRSADALLPLRLLIKRAAPAARVVV